MKKVPPIFTYVGQRIVDMQDEYSKLNNENSQVKIIFKS